jgi:hypothetical protein
MSNGGVTTPDGRASVPPQRGPHADARPSPSVKLRCEIKVLAGLAADLHRRLVDALPGDHSTEEAIDIAIASRLAERLRVLSST